MDLLAILAELGPTVTGGLVMGYFIFLVIKQLLEGVVEKIKTLTIFCKGLESRARTMSNEMIKIDLLVSAALELRPDIDRVARAENFMEDGKIDVRRD
jgi:uncharacterized membrane protein